MVKKLNVMWGLLLLLNSFSIYSQIKIDSLLTELDKAIKKRGVYITVKESRIADFRKQLQEKKYASIEVYLLNNQLYEEYKQYNFDSALHYIYANLDLATLMNSSNRIAKSKLDLSAILTTTGMPDEAIENMHSIEKKQLEGDLLYDYYYTYKQAYQKLSEYTLNKKYAPNYQIKTKLYQDSLLQSVVPDSDSYLLEAGFLAFEKGDLKKAEQLYLDLCDNRLTYGTAIYARVAGTLASIYERKGQTALQKKYLILSAISDIKAVVKENASLTALAMLLYDEGEINRANQYIEYALEDANFYNARLRKIEISRVYPIINNAYQLQIEKQKNELRFCAYGNHCHFYIVDCCADIHLSANAEIGAGS